LVKKLMSPQVRSAAGQQSPPVVPANTTAPGGFQRARSRSAWTVMVWPAPGSAAGVVTGRPSLAGMPSASVAHMAEVTGPASPVAWIGGGGGGDGEAGGD